MLARPEIGTREHILLWLAGKPSDEQYEWCNSNECACGQYAKEHDIWQVWEASMGFVKDNPLSELNHLAEDYRTFGTLYIAARNLWRGTT